MSSQRANDNFYYNQNRDANSYIQKIKNASTCTNCNTSSTSSSTSSTPVYVSNQTNNTNSLMSFSGSASSSNTSTASSSSTSSSSSAATTFIQNSAIQANTNRSIANQANVQALNVRVTTNEIDIGKLETTANDLKVADITNKNALTTDINKVSTTLTTLSGDIYGKYTALTTSVNGHTSDISLINGKIVDICGAIQNIVVNGTGSSGSGGTTTIPSDLTAKIETISGSIDDAWVSIRSISGEASNHLDAYNLLSGKVNTIEADIDRLESNVSALSTINDISGTLKNLLSDTEVLAKLDASATQFAGDIQGIKDDYIPKIFNLNQRVDKVDTSINIITGTTLPAIDTKIYTNKTNLATLTETVSSNKSAIETTVEDLSNTFRAAVLTYDLSGKIDTNKTNLATLTGTVSSNKSAIETTVNDLSNTLRTAVFTYDLSGKIDTNKTNLATLTGTVSSNKSAIETTVNDLSSALRAAVFTYDLSGKIDTNKTNLATLTGTVSSNKSAIETTVNDLSNAFRAAVFTNNLSGKISDNARDISDVSGVAAQNKTNIATLTGTVSSNKTAIETTVNDLSNAFRAAVITNNLEGKISNNARDISDLSGVVNTQVGLFNELSGNVSRLVFNNLSGEVILTRDISDISGRVLTNKTNLATLTGTVSSNKTAIETTVNDLSNAFRAAVLTYDLSGKIDTNKTNLATLTGTVSSNKSTIETTVEDLSNALRAAVFTYDLSGKIDTNKTNLATLTGTVSSNKSAIETTVEDLSSALRAAVFTNNLSGKISDNAGDISDVSGVVATNTASISGLTTKVTSLSGSVDSIISNLTVFDENVDAIKQASSLSNKLDGAISNISDVSGRVLTLSGDISDLSGRITASENADLALSNRIDYSEAFIPLLENSTGDPINLSIDVDANYKVARYIINGVEIIGHTDTKHRDIKFLPPFLDNNGQYISTIAGIDFNSSATKTIDLKKPFSIIKNNSENPTALIIHFYAVGSTNSQSARLPASQTTNLKFYKQKLEINEDTTNKIKVIKLDDDMATITSSKNPQDINQRYLEYMADASSPVPAHVFIGDISMNGALAVGGATTLKNNLDVSGTTTLNGATTLNGGLTVAGGNSVSLDGLTGLTVGGATNLNGGLNVTSGSVSLTGTTGLEVAGATTLKNGATVEGAVTHAKNGLTVDGATTLNNGLTVANGASSLGGETTFGGKTIFNADASMNNALVVAGATTLNNGLNVTSGSVSLTGTTASGLTVTGATTLNNALTVAGATTLNNGLNVTSGSVSLTGTTASGLTVTGATTLNNALTVAGATTLNDQLILKTSTASKPLLINTADPFDGNTAQVLGATPWYGRTASPAFLIDGVKGNYTFTDLNFKLAPKSAVYPGEVATTRYKIEADGAHTWYDNNGTTKVMEITSDAITPIILTGKTLRLNRSLQTYDDDYNGLFLSTNETNIVDTVGFYCKKLNYNNVDYYNLYLRTSYFGTASGVGYKEAVLYGNVDHVSSKDLNFTGFHRSILENKTDETNHKKYTGLIVEATGKLNNIFYDKNIENDRYKPNETEALPTVRLTTTRASKRVFGIVSTKEKLVNGKREYNTTDTFSSMYDIDTSDELEMTQRYNIASVGEGMVYMVLRDEDRKPENGDLIISSDLIAGYGELQDDDLVRNITVGKLTCDWDYEYLEEKIVDGYKCKLMSCVYYCG